MADFKQQYKNPRQGFGDAEHNRYLRACNRDKSRREVRTQTFDRNRDLQDVSPSSPQPKDVSTIADERMKKLIRWKEDRERKKRLEAAMKKPAFKVGIVHHALCSPIIKKNASTAKTPKKTEQSNYVQKRITRATEKRLLAKEAAKEIASKQGAKNLSSISTKHPIRGKMTSNTRNQKSFAPDDYSFKPPSGLQKIPLFGLVPMKQTPQEKYTSEKDVRTSPGTTKNSKTSTGSKLSSNKQSLSQKDIQTSDGTTKNFKTSTSSKLSSNKQNSSQKLIDLTIHDSNDLNVTKKTRSSLKEQTKNQTDLLDFLQEEKSSSDNELVKESSDKESSDIDMETPPSHKINSIFPEKENRSMNLIIFSPYLVRSRGKKNSRKEGQQRLGIGRPSDEIPTKDTVMKNLNICVEEEERTAQYFKLLLNKETDRLQQLCKKWLQIGGLEKDIPEDAMYEIQQAVGQTNLLMNKKFKRFRGLVQDCETGRGEMLVTCRDLQGFWETTYMQVKDCDMRFQKLEQRQNRGWQEEEESTVQAKPAVKKRMPVKKQIVSSKPSALRSFLLAARKNKMEIETLKKEDLLLQDIHTNEKSSNRKSCTELLEENTDTRRRARRSKSNDLNESKSTSVQRKNSRTSFIQMSDKSKRMKSPFAAMKISRMCKTPEVQLDNTVSYVNSDQTPGKSILKKSEELESKEARIKSTHKVNFDDHVSLTEVPLDEDAQINFSLSVALNKIESFNLDETCINAEKKLNFDTEEFDSNDDLNELQSNIQTIGNRNKSKSPVQNSLDKIVYSLNTTFSVVDSSSNTQIISPPKSSENRVQYKDVSNKQDVLFSPPAQANRNDETRMTELISNDMEDFGLGKALRNRTVLTNNTPKSNRTSKMTPKKIDKGENKSSVKSNRKSLRLSQKNENMTPRESDTTEMEDVTLINSIKKRSSRKSVAFDESCVACAENKPVLPMTPYSSRRSRTSKRQSRSKTALDGDLIILNTPDSRRITRSHQSDKF